MTVSFETFEKYLSTRPLFPVSSKDRISVIFLLYLCLGADVAGTEKAFEQLTEEQLCGLVAYVHYEEACREGRDWEPPAVA